MKVEAPVEMCQSTNFYDAVAVLVPNEMDFIVNITKMRISKGFIYFFPYSIFPCQSNNAFSMLSTQRSLICYYNK